MPSTFGITTKILGLLGKPYGVMVSSGTAVAIAHAVAPFTSVYPWRDGVGFGTKFANPATPLPSTANGVKFSPNANTIFIAHSTAAPGFQAYLWTSAGFGTKFADPALPGNIARDIAVRDIGSPTTNWHVAIANFYTPEVYNFSKAGAGWGTRFADPASVPPGTGNGTTFSDEGNLLAISHSLSPWTSAFPWTNAGFGTRFANPAVLPTEVSGTVAGGVAFSSPTTNTLAQTQNSSGTGAPLVNAWNFSAAGYGTKFADPLYPPGSPSGSVPSRRVRYTKSGTSIMMGQAIGAVMGGMIGWKWSNGFQARYTLNFPLTINVDGVAWNDSATTLFAAHATATPFMFARPWNPASGMGTAYASPATLPTGSGDDVAVAR